MVNDPTNLGMGLVVSGNDGLSPHDRVLLIGSL